MSNQANIFFSVSRQKALKDGEAFVTTAERSIREKNTNQQTVLWTWRLQGIEILTESNTGNCSNSENLTQNIEPGKNTCPYQGTWRRFVLRPALQRSVSVS